jgi:outer membrane protein OmpA-like peptidoglycan-associated protein
MRIPFVVGLSTVRVVASEAGDYEMLRLIDSIDANSHRVVLSGEAPADDGTGLLEVRIVRVVRAEDQRASRKMRVYFHTGDAQVFPGTVPGFSAAVMNDLRKTGQAHFTYVDVSMMFGMAATRELSGTLRRIEGPATLPMQVNGRSVMLPVIHAKGSLSDGSAAQDFEFYVLEDPDNPIVLRWSGIGSTSQVIRIEYPEPDAIERTLAANEPAEIYGIHFSFARADIRPQSEGVLKEIATVLRGHPDWRLRIDGHTDGIGNAAANLELSKRRAAAVKVALIDRYGIAAARLSTDGHGEASPKDTNNKPEGRARNRRVELRRE